jgi:hypothetical protein
MSSRPSSATPAVASRFESPHRTRIHQLAAKLSGLQSHLEDEKVSRIEAIEARLRHMDDRITALLQSQDKRMLAVRDAVSQCEHALEEEKRAREVLSDAKAREIAAADQRLQAELESTVKTRRDMESRMMAVLDDKIRTLMVEHQHSNHVFVGVNERIADTTRVRDAIAQERRIREEQENGLIVALSNELTALLEQVEVERRERERAEDALVRALQDVAGRVQNGISLEKKDREETEETLLALLEDTCTKLNEANTF